MSRTVYNMTLSDIYGSPAALSLACAPHGSLRCNLCSGAGGSRPFALCCFPLQLLLVRCYGRAALWARGHVQINCLVARPEVLLHAPLCHIRLACTGAGANKTPHNMQRPGIDVLFAAMLARTTPGLGGMTLDPLRHCKSWYAE